MNRKIAYSATALVVIVLAYPGLAWLIGMRVEAAIDKREQLIKDQMPGTITLISRQYQRGVYGASEVLVYGLSPTILRALGPLAAVPDIGALKVTVRNTIHHGPLPQMRAIGMATIDTQVELPPDLSAKLKALLGGEPTVQVRTRLGWRGGSTSVVTSAGYQGRMSNGAEISWHDFKVTGSADANLSSNTIDGDFGGMEFKSDKFQTNIDAVHFGAAWQRAFDVLYTGPFDVKIASVKWQSLPPASRGSVQGFAIDGSAVVDGDFYKSAVNFGADAVEVPGFSMTHLGYDISVEHLHAPTLAAMMKTMRTAQANVGSSAPMQALPAQVLGPLKTNGVELLLHEPVVNISRIGFTMPEGELRLSASVSVPGLKREDIEGPQFPAGLIQHLNVVADLRVDAALLTKLLEKSGRKDQVSAQVDAFEHQGYIKVDGKALTSHLTFTGGKLMVNGQAFPPGQAQ
jgi:uncharacterized protein YdgA (DUF945 family)